MNASTTNIDIQLEKMIFMSKQKTKTHELKHGKRLPSMKIFNSHHNNDEPALTRGVFLSVFLLTSTGLSYLTKDTLGGIILAIFTTRGRLACYPNDGLHCCHRNDSLRVRSGIPGWI